MGNKLLSCQRIAREALPILKNNLVVPALFRTDYSKEYVKEGDTIQVKKPAVFEAKDFKDEDEVTIQEINQDKVLVKMDKIADVSVEITSKELTMDPVTFRDDVLEPAMVAIAEKINKEGLEMYKYAYKTLGTAGTTPNTIDIIAQARGLLNKAKAPLKDRYGVWDPDADVKFSTIDAILNAEKSGSTQALREGSIGRIQGIDNYMSQQVAVHKAGTFTGVASPKVNAKATKGADTIAIKGGSSTETLVAGDVFTINNKPYVVVKDAAAETGVITVNVYPSLIEDVNADTDIVFVDKNSGGHVANMVFNKNAFAFVTRPLELPVSNQEAYVVSYGGLNLRVVYGYDMKKKKNMLSMDTIYGFAPLYPSLAATILG